MEGKDRNVTIRRDGLSDTEPAEVIAAAKDRVKHHTERGELSNQVHPAAKATEGKRN